MVLLFTFGSGTLGELGTGRLDDAKRSKAVVVEFPVSAPRNADGEPALEAIALGTDHSLALLGNHVYRWGLLGASMDHQRRGDLCQPEVVPEPVSISELVLFAGKDDGQNIKGSLSNPDGFVRSITCGGSNSFMVNFQGEMFMVGSLKSRAGNPDCLRHIWGNPRGDASCRVARVSAGWRHCLILTEAGTVFALGDDEHGQCAGVGTGTVAVSLPKGQTPEAIVGISAGACHSLAWCKNGSVYSWGHGGSGRLGVGGTRNRRAPARVEMIQDSVAFARCGANFTVFATSYGRSLWACGGNQYGQLGVGGESRNACEVPVPLGFPQNGQEVVSLDCGANHVLCLTRYEDTYERLIAWAWGCASSGQCGRICEEETNKAFPASRSIPGALADFLPPTQNWPLAISAGRSHSAVLAQIGRPTDEDVFNSVNMSKSEIASNLAELVPSIRNCRKLPEVPKESDTIVDAMGAKIATAPNHQWLLPEGGSISHIHRMGGETTLSPLRATSQSPPMQTHLDPNTIAQDDIIDLFCAGLSLPNNSPNRLPSPPHQSAVSPVVGDLIKFGEATLHRDDTTHMSSILTQEQPSAIEVGHRKKIQLATSASVRRNIVTGARRPSTKVARSSTPQRGVNTSWPQPPSSWSATSRRRASSQQNRTQHQRRRGSQSPSLERTHQHVATTPPPSQPTSMWEAHPGPYLAGISTLSTTMDAGSPHCVEGSPKLPSALSHIGQAAGMQVPLNTNPFAAREYGMTVSQPLPSAKQHDEWTGVHASLQGLTTMIASIGRFGISASPTQSFHTVARDIAAGGTGSPFQYGHASTDMNANVSGYHHGANGSSPPRQRRSQGVVLPSSPPSVPQRNAADAAALSHNSSPVGHWTSPHRLDPSPRRLSSHTSPAVQKWEQGTPRECGSDSDTHLDFSPRSTGSSPPQRAPARRRLSNTPTRRKPVAVAPTHVPVAVVTNPFMMESVAERSMFVLNGTGQVPLSPCSEEPPSADSIGRALDQSGTSHGGEKNDRFIEDTHVVPGPFESTRRPEPELPAERKASPRSPLGGLAPLVLEASGPTADALDPYSKRSSATGGLEIPPPLSLSRRASADSADTADSVLKNATTRRDSNNSKSSAKRSSNASSTASVSKPNTVTFPLVDGLSLGTAQDRESRDSVEELQTPAFGKRMSGGRTEDSSSSEEDQSDGASSSSSRGSSQPAPKAAPATGTLAKRIESEDGSDSDSASDSSDSSSDNSDEDSSQANKGQASTPSDWV